MSIESLPSEVIVRILQFLPPESLLLIQATSKFLALLANEPLLWRDHCKSRYCFWHPRHSFTSKLNKPVKDVNWKQLFVERRCTDRIVSNTLQAILSSRQNRIPKIEIICEKGYDAKDEILRHCRAASTVEDRLARQYWSKTILGCIHRAIAINTWENLKSAKPPPLEDALAAFDMFVLGTSTGDIIDTATQLDRLATKLLRQHTEFKVQTTRQKAATLANFMRSEDMVGISCAWGAGRTLDSNLIGFALQNAHHQSHPLVTAAIYSALAQRVNLKISPCNFPWHVYAVLQAPEGETLDGGQCPHSRSVTTTFINSKAPSEVVLPSPNDVTYFDPFRSSTEVPISTLNDILIDMNIHPVSFPSSLNPASVPDMVMRTARNITNSMQVPGLNSTTLQPTDCDSDSGYVAAAADAVQYACLWALMILDGVESGQCEEQRQQRLQHRPQATLSQRDHLIQFKRLFRQISLADVGLVERLVAPMLEDSSEGESLKSMISWIRKADRLGSLDGRIDMESRASTLASALSPKGIYVVGQIFRHRRYGYQGVIVGRDVGTATKGLVLCAGSEPSVTNVCTSLMYRILAEDHSIRYVAEDNMTLDHSMPSKGLLGTAGRFFKRWDPASDMFCE